MSSNGKKNGNGNGNGHKDVKLPETPLNLRQEKFVENYLKTGNITQSAIEAGYSEASAAEVGRQVLRNLEIQARIEERRKSFIASANIKAAEVIGGFVQESQHDILELFSAEGFIGVEAARKAKLGHLIKAFSVREPKERAETTCDHKVKCECGKEHICGATVTFPVKITRVEVHSQQQARKELAEILGLKQQPRLNDRDKLDLSRRIKQEWIFWTQMAEKVKAQHGLETSREELIETICGGYDVKLRDAIVREIETIQ